MVLRIAVFRSNKHPGDGKVSSTYERLAIKKTKFSVHYFNSLIENRSASKQYFDS